MALQLMRTLQLLDIPVRHEVATHVCRYALFLGTFCHPPVRAGHWTHV